MQDRAIVTMAEPYKVIWSVERRHFRLPKNTPTVLKGVTAHLLLSANLGYTNGIIIIIIFNGLERSLYTVSKSRPSLTLYIRNGTRYRHSFSGLLIGTYIRPTVLKGVTSNDLE